MSTVISFLTNISIQGQKLAYVDTAPFSINGTTYRGIINTSQSGTDFIITQRFTNVLFHNIQISESQFMVQVTNSSFIPAEIKSIIGTNQYFLSTVNTQTAWFLRSVAVPGSSSNVDLTISQSGFITNSSGLFLTNVNGQLTMGTNAGPFNTVKPADSNIIIGSVSLSGDGGGGGTLTLTPSGALSSSYYLPFSSTISGPVTIMGTDVSGLIYDNNNHSLTVNSVVTNKLGLGLAPNGGPNNISIGDNALLANAANMGQNNIAIGVDALVLNTNGEANVSIGFSTMYNNTLGNNNVSIGTSTLYNNTVGNSNIAIGGGAMISNINGNNNTVIGTDALLFLSGQGNSNIIIGGGAGIAYTNNESNNILIGNNGMSGDGSSINTGIIRIGNNTNHIAAHIAPVLLRKNNYITKTVNTTLTAAEILSYTGGIISANANISLTLPTSSDIIAALGGNVTLGDTFEFTLSAPLLVTITLLGNTNVTILGPSTTTNNTRKIVMIYDDPNWRVF